MDTKTYFIVTVLKLIGRGDPVVTGRQIEGELEIVRINAQLVKLVGSAHLLSRTLELDNASIIGEPDIR